MSGLTFTGFGPFADVEYNPSWDAAQAAADVAGAAAVQLDVTLDVARGIRDIVASDGLSVHFGVSRRDTTVRLERYAHNWWRDIGELQPRRLDANGPVARECALALDEWARELGWVVSHDAGLYVCNATLYYALAAGAETAAFVHIPVVDAATAREMGAALGNLLAELS